MGATQVTNLHPVQVGGDQRDPLVVKNESAVTVYYRQNPFVSSTKNDGSLTQNQTTTISYPTWFITGGGPEVGKTFVPEEAQISVKRQPNPIPGRRHIHTLESIFKESLAVGTYFSVASVYEKATALALSSGENNLDTFWYEPSQYEIPIKSNSLTLDVLVLCDNVAPTNKFKFGLYKLEKSEAAEKKLTLTFEAVVASSLVEVSEPAAKSISHAEATFLNVPAGAYTIGVETTTATSAAKSFESITAKLFAT